MKNALFILILFILCSCNNSLDQQTKKSEGQNNKTETKKEIDQTEAKRLLEETAHSYGCITVEEFKELAKERRFSYMIEKELPLLLYVDMLEIKDIVSNIPEQKSMFSPNIELDLYLSSYINTKGEVFEQELSDDYGDLFIGESPLWSGKPSERKNECWMFGSFGNSYINSLDGFVGVDESKTEWVVQNSMKGTYLGSITIELPVIIQINQIKKSNGISINADLIEILNQ